MINPMEMTGRTVLVTGASSGIGRACAVLLSQLGARLVLVARDTERLRETQVSLEGDGHVVEPFDLTQGDQIPEWMAGVAARHGVLGGLVHAAGVHAPRPIRAVRQEHIDPVLNVNVSAGLLLARAFRQKSVAGPDASLVYLASVSGLVGEAAIAAYAASKGAVIAMTKSLALELARDGIRVNCVAPALVRTDMADDLERATGTQLAALEALHPLGLGQPRDVAYAVAFLLAATGRWITGTTLVVDGGYTAR